MGDGLRWVIGLACALLVIGLIVEARGRDHYRGDEVGSHGTKVVVVVPPPG
jgi:hypothetical protein